MHRAIRVVALTTFVLLHAGSSPFGVHAAEKSKVVIGATVSLAYIPVHLASALGYYREIEDRLKVTVDVQMMNSGTDTMKALIARQADFTVQQGVEVIQVRAQAQDARILSTWINTGVIAVMVKPESPYTTVKDLDGKTWGITAFGAGVHLQSVSIAQAFGLDVGKVRFLPVAGGANYIPALQAGKVDAIGTGEPSISKMEYEKIGRALVDLYDPETTRKVFGGPVASSVLVTRGDVIKEHPELTQAVVAAHQKAVRWLLENRSNPDLVWSKLPASAQSAKAYGSSILRRITGAMSADGLTGEEAVAAVIKNLKDTDQIPANARLDPKDAFDNSFVRKAGGQ